MRWVTAFSSTAIKHEQYTILVRKNFKFAPT